MCLSIEKLNSRLPSLTGGLEICHPLYHPCHFYFLDHSHIYKHECFFSLKKIRKRKLSDLLLSSASISTGYLTGYLISAAEYKTRWKVVATPAASNFLPRLPWINPNVLLHCSTNLLLTKSWMVVRLLDSIVDFKSSEESRHFLLPADFVWRIRFHM